MGAPGLVTLFKPGSVPYRGMETSTGESIVHWVVSSMRGRCTRHWLAVKVAQQDNVFKERKTVQKEIYWLYKERGIVLSFFVDNHILFKCNEPCKHLSCFVSLFFAISLNFNCLTFLFIFVQFCNFYFCTLGQINECVHSCVTFYFMITYQVERQLNFR